MMWSRSKDASGLTARPLWRASCLMISLLSVATVSVAQPTITVNQYALPEQNQRWRITTGPDGALWFTEGPYDTIGRITTSGVITHYSLPIQGGYPHGIASGPDGALWFTRMNAQPFLGRITVDGSITEYNLPSTESGNIWSEIAAGFGDLWTTRWCHGIDRVTTAGTASEILFQTCPTGIITGPDGAVWFTDAGTGSIGRIGVDGSVTSFPLPYDHQYSLIAPHSMTVGPDEALWFTADHPSQTGSVLPKIGRLTTSGALTTYDLSGQGVFGNRIIAGPDGALWFTVFNYAKIGRISTDGVFTMYSVPGTGVTNGFNDITLGPDGALWLVGDGSSIVQVIVEQVDTTPPVITPAVVGFQGNNGWYTDFVTLSWTVTDPESGIASSSPGCFGAHLSTNTLGTTFTCSATNGAGLSASVPVTIKLDRTPPGVQPLVSGTLGSNGWYTSPVTVTWNVADSISGIASSSGCGTTTLTASTSGVTLGCTATNGAGLSNSDSISIKIDLTQAWVDVTSKLQIAVSGFALNRITNTLSGSVTFKNITADTIPGPFYFIPANLGPDSIFRNQTGVRPDNTPYLLVDGLTALAPGATASVRVQFRRTAEAITFDPKFFAGGL